jgi:hypothetical protein
MLDDQRFVGLPDLACDRLLIIGSVTDTNPTHRFTSPLLGTDSAVYSVTGRRIGCRHCHLRLVLTPVH